MANQRTIEGVYKGPEPHWVGDGFRVSNYFPSGNRLGTSLSPFLLMDYHAPYSYSATTRLRGVGPHPHRGFETVTIAWQGAVAHHDSAGNAGTIGPGDVQWMTAASGILHKEYHAAEFARTGGSMHMMQLWVNLPRAHKMGPPRYQPLLGSDMGRVVLADGAGTVRIIAGGFRGVEGPAKTFSPIHLWDIQLIAGGRLDAPFPELDNVGVLVLDGDVQVGDGTRAARQELVVFGHQGDEVHLEAKTASHILLLGGAPIHEPVVQYGPFVMGSEQEIREAIADFNSGKFGTLA